MLSVGFFAERGGFFLDGLLAIEESVVAPAAGLILRGGDEGGVLRKFIFCACGVLFFLGGRRLVLLLLWLLLRGPLGVGGWGDCVDMTTIWLEK